jgi:exodeoxyribonuclease-3
MKIATYNVNSINARMPILLRWLEESKPDVVCLQELKTVQEKFPILEIQAAGYQAIWHGQKSWNGVAILTRNGEAKELHRGLPGDPEDEQSRFIVGEVDGIQICCLYLPNGNPTPGPKYDYKLRWMERLRIFAEGLVNSGKPTLLIGDFNVIPTGNDVYKPERWVNDALFRVETRDAFEALKAQGWTDAIRHLHPDETIYTFWDYFRDAFGRNAGLRIDHFLLNSEAMPRLNAAGVDKHVRGWEKSSDHAPVWIEME